MDDGRLVYLKRVQTASEELRIARLLSNQAGPGNDSDNHAVPILDVFQDALDSDESCIVMPFLHYFDQPSFEHVMDVVDFVDQMLEVGIITRRDLLALRRNTGTCTHAFSGSRTSVSTTMLCFSVGYS